MSVRNVWTSGTKGVGRGVRREGAFRRCMERHWRQVKVRVGEGRLRRVEGRLSAIWFSVCNVSLRLSSSGRVDRYCVLPLEEREVPSRSQMASPSLLRKPEYLMQLEVVRALRYRFVRWVYCTSNNAPGM